MKSCVRAALLCLVVGALVSALLLALIVQGGYTTVRDATLAITHPIKYSAPRPLASAKLVRPWRWDKSLTRLTLPILGTRINTIVPLTFSRSEGIYWIRFHVNGDRVRAVFDTGSSSLVLSTAECIRGGTCDARNGAYDHSDAQRLHDQSVTLTYGSQSVDSVVVIDSMDIQGFEVDSELCTDVVMGKGKLRGGASTTVVQRPTRVHAATEMRGSTAANVFGAAPNKDHTSIMDNILPKGAHSWGVFLGSKGGLWTIGAAPTDCGVAQRMHYVPIRRPPSVRSAHTQFYIVRLHDILVGADTASMRSVFTVPHKAMWLLLDTGSTATYTSRALWQPMFDAGIPSRWRPLIVLVLDNNIQIVLEPETYTLNGEAMIDTSTDFVNMLLGGQEGMLLGCTAMRGLFIQHDIQHQRIGFASAPPPQT